MSTLRRGVVTEFTHEEDVDEEVCVAATLEEHTHGGKEDREAVGARTSGDVAVEKNESGTYMICGRGSAGEYEEEARGSIPCRCLSQ